MTLVCCLPNKKLCPAGVRKSLITLKNEPSLLHGDNSASLKHGDCDDWEVVMVVVWKIYIYIYIYFQAFECSELDRKETPI